MNTIGDLVLLDVLHVLHFEFVVGNLGGLAQLV